MQEASKMDKILLFDEGEIIARGTNKELIDFIRPFVYEQSTCAQECLTFNKKTYSLAPLDAKKAEPTLEGLFFVNALQKKKLLPKVDIANRDEDLAMPPVVMQGNFRTTRC